jgi:hypothetical protein
VVLHGPRLDGNGCCPSGSKVFDIERIAVFDTAHEVEKFAGGIFAVVPAE